jgi:hypothetical protein
LILDDALAGETARITEVSESGSVPELRFENDGANPVLLHDRALNRIRGQHHGTRNDGPRGAR